MNNKTDYMKNFKNVTARVEQETEYGLYVWRMEDGRYVGDSQGRLMAIPSKQGDISRISKIRQEAKSLGIEGGEPHYMPDVYPVTDGEYESMRERMDDGLMGDPADPGNLGSLSSQEYDK